MDPNAIKEGFVNVNDYLGDVSMNPETWIDQANKTGEAIKQRLCNVKVRSCRILDTYFISRCMVCS